MRLFREGGCSLINTTSEGAWLMSADHIAEKKIGPLSSDLLSSNHTEFMQKIKRVLGTC